ncbi:Tim44 domain-containing protein [Aliivibrio finisterrensis]|uniref:Tim44 domain-containing protein n=1 Tax=Aliivibrio finisterrensis TaxID=511998 RepID=A0A6N6RSD7_9GAMM|nr:Tim44 domain-containing protein [Aliivibrio finisterrensis]KAB2824479.1 Tim44 domain-containing protein [Aliivibrio finisterrensis]
MKRLLSIAALMFVFVLSAPHAEAKKFGGGKSFGKSFKTAPAPKQKQQNTNTIGKQDTAKGASSKKGLMGGLLGGLLMGGLLASIFAGGGFEGIQFMDILIIAGVAFMLFKLFRMFMASKASSINQRQGTAYASPQASNNEQPSFRDNQQYFQGEQAQPQPQATGGFGAPAADEIPHNYPPGFDVAGFINGSREHYRILQGAWNHNQLETIQEYVSISLYNDLVQERANLEGEQHTDVMFVDAEVVRADHDANRAQLSLQFSGRYRDSVEGVEEDITDIWHLERDLTQPNAPWLIIGIQA